MSKTIIVIEDEKDIRELITFNLDNAGFQTKAFANAEEGLDFILNSTVDLLLLDIMLPGMNGSNLCKILKNNSSTKNIPIIMLTAKSDEDDIVDGLELGADEYITKPFSPKVLIAKIHTLLRRTESFKSIISSSTPNIIKFQELTLNLDKRRAFVDGLEVNLTYTEFQCLKIFLECPGHVFSREQIIQQIRGENHAITDRSVDVQIVNLRKKIGDNGAKFIETVRGAGYRFKEA